MTDLEILAQLKTAYLSLEDIVENEDKQILKKERNHLIASMQELEFIYDKLWYKIAKKNKQILFYEKDVQIADTILYDYVTRSEDYDDQFLFYADTTKGTKWWEDYEYLRK